MLAIKIINLLKNIYFQIVKHFQTERHENLGQTENTWLNKKKGKKTHLYTLKTHKNKNKRFKDEMITIMTA